MAQETSFFDDLGAIVGMTASSLGDIAKTVTSEVREITSAFSSEPPAPSPSKEQQEVASYFAKSVDDPVKNPPLNDEMKAQVAERQAYERIGEKLRQSGAEPSSLSKEELQALMTQDRMQSYLDQQKQKSMC